MTNTATLTRIDEVQIDRRSDWIALASTCLAALMFIIAMITLRPFRSSDTATANDVVTNGDVLNQIGYGALACVALVGMLCLADARRLYALISPSWLIMLAFVALGTVTAMDPVASVRGAAFTLAAMIVICAVLVLPRDGSAMAQTIVLACVAVLAINYAGVLALPGLAIHGASGPQPEHVGLWRGSFSHKNTAGPVMACLAFAGFYVLRRGWTVIGIMIVAAATLFIVKTGSKTTLALVPLSMMVVVIPATFGWRAGTIAAFLVAMIGATVATLGVVFIPDVKAMAHFYFPDLTYTGRTDIWQFAGQFLADRPWTGYGFESFWSTRIVDDTLRPFDGEWDVRGAGHAHNGYLDVALALGLPALVVFVVAFIVEPVRDYLRIPARTENVYLGDLFMMILFFTMLNASLESFFFRRADPIWLLVVFSAMGLRMVSRTPLRADWRG